jgi:glycosyltransferase involved in cell wall biosynthesis
MITVIITVHAPLLQYLSRAAESVLWQLEDSDQLIIVGDRVGDDGELEVVRGPRSAWVSTYVQRREVLSGVSATRNLGLAHAIGQWIKFLDADDVLAPFALAHFRALVAKGLPEKVGVVAGGLMRVHNGVVTGLQNPPDINAVITKVNPLLVSVAFVRRAAASAVAGFDARIDFEEDWDFWLRLRQAGWEFAWCGVPFCYYWIADAERAEKEQARTHRVEGVDVRDYLAKTYGITPQR